MSNLQSQRKATSLDILEKRCRNCGSTEVDIIKSGTDLHPFFSYRIYGLRSRARVKSTRLRMGKKLKMLDTVLFGFLSKLGGYCIDAECEAWNTTDAMICHSCEFYCIHHLLDESMLEHMYVDYRTEAYQKDWEDFEPGYIKTVGQYIGGADEAACRLKSMDPYLREMLKEYPKPFDAFEAILDWGGSDGINLPGVFSKARRYVHDISGWAPVEGVTMLNSIDGSVQFDYIQIMHVLEHVLRPIKFLEGAIAHLKPGGILYLEVPVEFSGTGLVTKALNNERRLKVHEHINLYTPRSLEALARTLDLQVLDIRTEIIDFYWCEGPCLRLLAAKR